MRDFIAQWSLLGGLLIAGAYLSAGPSLPWAALASALIGATLCIATIIGGALWDRLVTPPQAPTPTAAPVPAEA
jgi:hypothetical protein